MPAAESWTSQHRGLDLSGSWTPRLPGDLIEHWTTTIPDRPALTFIDYLADRSGPRRAYTWSEWGQWTRAVAHRLQELAGRTDRVAILAPQGPEYVAAFHGALRAGVIAVPLFQPDLPGHGDRLELVFDDCQPAVVITTAEKVELVEKLLASRGLTGQVEIVLPSDLAGERGAQRAAAFVPPADLRLDDIAYLQYTSGSTRAPAGVELTHLNLVYNLFQIIQANGLKDAVPNVTGVSWLPLFHDMGLLLGAGATAVTGVHSVLMDPISFILKPARWVSELAAHPNVFSAAPNFAYAVAAKKSTPDVLGGLDFSRVTCLINGAEPVLSSTIDAFTATFGPYGLPATAQRPSYGLAEATLFVCVGDPADPRVVINADVGQLQSGILTEAADTSRGTPIVSPGRPFGNDVVIIDVATGAPVPPGHVGEIWVHSPSVGRGYWRKPQETQDTFGGTLTQQQASSLGVATGPWLRTGDLGAILGPDVFITGRHKDLIIVDGRNVYPHDIEYSVEQAHAAIARHRLAAFPVPVTDGEGIVVVAEQFRAASGAGSMLAEIDAAARQRVSEEHSVALHDFVLIASNTIPWTSSGKIARRATKDAYLAGTLTRVMPV